MTPARVVYIALVATALALALVLQSAAIRESGYRLEDLRAEIAEVRTEHAVHLAHVSKLKSPRRVLSLVQTLGLGLQERPVEVDGVEAVEDTTQSEQTTVASLADDR